MTLLTSCTSTCTPRTAKKRSDGPATGRGDREPCGPVQVQPDDTLLPVLVHIFIWSKSRPRLKNER